MAKKSKAVAKKETAGNPALLDELHDLGYTGMEDVDESLLQIPFLKIAQPTTSQAQKGSPVYIPGLEPGMFYSSVSGKVYGKKVQVIFFGFSHSFLEWNEEDSTLEARYMPDEVQKMLDTGAMKKDGLKLTKDGKKISENYVMYTAVAGSFQDKILLLPFKSTGIKHFKKIIGKTYAEMMPDKNGKAMQAPIFYNVWEMGTVLNTNDKGQSWYLIGDKGNVSVKKLGNIETEFKKISGDVLSMARFVKELKTREREFDLSEVAASEKDVSQENPFAD